MPVFCYQKIPATECSMSYPCKKCFDIWLECRKEQEARLHKCIKELEGDIKVISEINDVYISVLEVKRGRIADLSAAGEAYKRSPREHIGLCRCVLCVTWDTLTKEGV